MSFRIKRLIPLADLVEYRDQPSRAALLQVEFEDGSYLRFGAKFQNYPNWRPLVLADGSYVRDGYAYLKMLEVVNNNPGEWCVESCTESGTLFCSTAGIQLVYRSTLPSERTLFTMPQPIKAIEPLDFRKKEPQADTTQSTGARMLRQAQRTAEQSREQRRRLKRKVAAARAARSLVRQTPR